MSTGSVEVVYRGIFQKTLAKNICRGIVLAARKEGKIGIAFGRYGARPTVGVQSWSGLRAAHVRKCGRDLACRP